MAALRTLGLPPARHFICLRQYAALHKDSGRNLLQFCNNFPNNYTQNTALWSNECECGWIKTETEGGRRDRFVHIRAGHVAAVSKEQRVFLMKQIIRAPRDLVTAANGHINNVERQQKSNAFLNLKKKTKQKRKYHLKALKQRLSFFFQRYFSI